MSSLIVEVSFEDLVTPLLVVIEQGDAEDREAARRTLRLIARHADVVARAGRAVVDSWESGDLAGAVRELDAALDAALFDA